VLWVFDGSFITSFQHLQGYFKMVASVPSRVGQINGAGDVDALFLKVFGGEVLTAFEQATVMKNRVTLRQIAHGKSAQFPRAGRISAAYHVPGAEITGLSMNHGEITIIIDDLLISHAFLANIDEAKNHYDVRSIYSTEIGRALATQWDRHLFQLGVIASMATNVITGLPGGTVITTTFPGAPASANFATNGAHIAAALFLAAQRMDENDVPGTDRVAFFNPAQYYALASTTNNINKDWGGQGAYSDGKVLRIAGFEIVKTTNVPNTDLSAVTDVRAGTGNRYRANFLNFTGLCMHKSALGTVQLMGLGMESEYDIRRQGTLMVAKYAVGHGVLRPEAVVSIKNAAS
jgi:hypothetical protein